MTKLPAPFNDALAQALHPVKQKMVKPRTKDDEEEPGGSHRYQGPPTVQREGATNA